MNHYLPPRRQTHAAVTWSLLAALCLGLAGCALFDALKPALIPVISTLLGQLDDLLLTYETAELPQNPSNPEIQGFLALQDARQAVLTDWLTQCSPHLTGFQIETYQKRINGVTVPDP